MLSEAFLCLWTKWYPFFPPVGKFLEFITLTWRIVKTEAEWIFFATSKGHALLDFTTDIPFPSSKDFHSSIHDSFMMSLCDIRSWNQSLALDGEGNVVDWLPYLGLFPSKFRSGLHSLSSLNRSLWPLRKWRALQTRSQYCARINLASQLVFYKKRTGIVKDMKKTAKHDLVFHAFNKGRPARSILSFQDVVSVSWGDANHKNRVNSSSTGGLVIGITTPEICSGTASPVTLVVTLVDWRSWKVRLIFALLQGLRLNLSHG